jgi:predicted nucleotidyltransferase
MIMDIHSILEEIVERLRPLDPDRIILFGSYAWGVPGPDSDLDVFVVTNDDWVPKTFRDTLDLERKVKLPLTDLRSAYPIDLIVQTEAMYSRFVQKTGSLSRQIIDEGIVLYARSHN